MAKAIDRKPSESGNIAAIDFGTANCSIAYCTKEDEKMKLLSLSKEVRVPTILLVNEDGEPIDIGRGAMRQYQRLDPNQKMKYHLFERIKLALGPDEVYYKNCDNTCYYAIAVQYILHMMYNAY